MQEYLSGYPPSKVLSLLVFALFGIYRTMWQYASAEDLIRLTLKSPVIGKIVISDIIMGFSGLIMGRILRDCLPGICPFRKPFSPPQIIFFYSMKLRQIHTDYLYVIHILNPDFLDKFFQTISKNLHGKICFISFSRSFPYCVPFVPFSRKI